MFGLNHVTAPVAIREQCSFSTSDLDNALNDLCCQEGISEAVILSTCNRTEIYCVVDSVENMQAYTWLHNYHSIAEATLSPYLFHHTDLAAVRHLFRVACGLDSMILGEPQVLGQLKQAYYSAVGAGSVGYLLERLLQHAFRAAKKIRSNTDIGNHAVSVAFSAVCLAKQIFGDLANNTALLIGAGGTIELVARYLQENGLQRLVIADRTLERAQRLASEFYGYAIPLNDIAHHLCEVDLVISATASKLPIISKNMVESALRGRKRSPILMVDLAVPRDIEEGVGELRDVYLYTVDDLKDIIQENIVSRQEAARQAEKIIDNQVNNFIYWMQSLGSVATIRALRGQAQEMQHEVMALAGKKIAAGRSTGKSFAGSNAYTG